MILKACKFKRTPKTNWEPGIRIEGETDILIDKKGNLVTKVPIYDIKDQIYDLCLDVTSILKGIML